MAFVETASLLGNHGKLQDVIDLATNFNPNNSEIKSPILWRVSPEHPVQPKPRSLDVDLGAAVKAVDEAFCWDRLPFVLEIKGLSVESFIVSAQDRQKNAFSKALQAAFASWVEMLHSDQVMFESQRIMKLGKTDLVNNVSQCGVLRFRCCACSWPHTHATPCRIPAHRACNFGLAKDGERVGQASGEVDHANGGASVAIQCFSYL